MRRRVYLDKNALSDLVKGESQDVVRARKRLLSPYFQRRPTLVVGVASAVELLKMSGHEQFGRELTFLKSVPTVWLKDLHDRTRTEIDFYYGHGDGDVFAPNEQVFAYLDHVAASPKDLRSVLDDHRRATRQYELGESRRKENVFRILPAPKLVGDAMLDDLSPVVTTWVNDFFEASRKVYRLPRNREDWPQPMGIPTLWSYYSYCLGRLAYMLSQNKKIDPNDLHDGEHYSAASYADDLVTSDKNLILYTSRCPVPKPRIVHFQAWVVELSGVTPPAASQPA